MTADSLAEADPGQPASCLTDGDNASKRIAKLDRVRAHGVRTRFRMIGHENGNE
jgi:hypothetical protein